MEGLSLLWQKALGSKPPKGRHRSRLYSEKVKLLSRLPESIYRGEEGARLSKEEIENLLSPIRSTLSAHTCVLLTRFLARGLANGNRTLNWAAAVPAVTLNFPRERARFTPQKFVELQQLRRIEEVLIASLADNILLTPEQNVGRMLLSAIIFGGLLQSRWLEPWLKAALNSVRSDPYFLWLDLERFWQYPRKATDGRDGSRKRNSDKTILMTRRWFADPLTRSLLLRWFHTPDNQRQLPKALPNAYDLVRMFLIKVDLTVVDLPLSAQTLLDMAGIRLDLTVTPFLSSYPESF